MSPEKLEKRRARERMRYVDPGNCGKITANDCYWTRQFLARYIAHCRSTCRKSPEDGYSLARPLPVLVERIRVRPDDVRYFDSEREKTAHLVVAYSVHGEACSLAGRSDEAELAFKRAADRLPAAAWAAAELKLAYGAHLARAEDPSAERHLADALSFWSQAEDETGLARAHLARGRLLDISRSERILELARAIWLADGRSKKGRAVRNQAIEYLCHMDFVFAAGLVKQRDAISFITNVQESFKGRSLDLQKARLVWIEGVLLGNLGVDRHAERLLEKARAHFRELESPSDLVMVTLDLARFLAAADDVEAVRRSRASTLEYLEGLDAESRGGLVEHFRNWREEETSALADIRRAVAAECGSVPK